MTTLFFLKVAFTLFVAFVLFILFGPRKWVRVVAPVVVATIFGSLVCGLLYVVWSV